MARPTQHKFQHIITRERQQSQLMCGRSESLWAFLAGTNFDIFLLLNEQLGKLAACKITSYEAASLGTKLYSCMVRIHCMVDAAESTNKVEYDLGLKLSC